MAKPMAKPKPVRPGNAGGKRAALIAAAVIAVGLGIVVILNRDKTDPADRATVSLEPIVDLVPEPLARDEIRTAGSDPTADGAMPDLDAGGWIQIVDRDTGKLAQQYRFTRLDPTPAGLPANWVRMDQPRAELYLSDDRVVRLSGDSAVVHLPHGVLESGSLTGNVLIEVFEPPPGMLLDDTRDDPILVVHAPQAAFDNVMGEVSCPDRFRVETPSLELLGSGLSLLINDQTKPVRASMEIADLEFARFAQQPVEPPAPARRPTRRPQTSPGTDTAAGATDAGSNAGTPAPTRDTQAAAAEQYYKLTLRDNVKIQEGIGIRVATGDSLVVLFTSESQGFSAAVPPASPPTAARSTRLTPRWLAPLVFGLLNANILVQQQPLGSSFTDRSIAPPITDTDIYITCTGGLSLVPIDDPTVTARLSSPQDSWMSLTGDPVVLLDRGQDARAVCDHLVFGGLQQTIRLVGSDRHPLTITAPRMDTAGETFWVRSGAAGFEGPGWLSSGPGGQSDAQQVRLTWSEGLDLDFEEASSASAGALGNLRRAAFRGDVVATSEGATLACDEHLVIDLETDAHGATAPTLMTATGNVRASDPQQTMWSDGLAVTFLEPDDRSPHSSPADTGAPLPITTIGSGSRVDEVTANGNVQVLLSNGARVFADRLHGNAARETVALTGRDVAIANKQWLIDRGHLLTLDRTTGVALWDGPGVARMFADDLPVGADRRIDRTTLQPDHQTRATWTGSMRYSDSAADGNGAIDLNGGVEMVSVPDPFQRTTFGADDVTIELASTEGTAGRDDTVERRVIGTVIGRGNARLEQRRWLTEAHTDEPRIFFVSGSRLDYDQRKGEASVPGPGRLLIRDLRPAAEGDQAGDGFAARGTTSFRWTTRLQMTQRTDTLFDIAMVDGIEMRHLDLAGQSTTLTCNRIDATVDRRGANEIDGPAELQHVRAAGEVFLRTPTRDVDCDLFDYDVRTGMARIEANPGQLVTIFTRGAPQPITLRGARWNMATDVISASAGTAGN